MNAHPSLLSGTSMPTVALVALLVAVASACSADVDLASRGCAPQPERCTDGIDNDCDGAIDEPACRTPPPEVCGNGIDDDEDGLIDEVCPCACDIASIQYDRTFVTGEVNPFLLGGFPVWNSSTAAWTGKETAFLLSGTAEGETDSALFMDRYDEAGARLGLTRLVPGLPDGYFPTTSLSWTGNHYVAAYVLDRVGYALLVNADGRPRGAAVELSGSLHWNGRELGRVWSGLPDGAMPDSEEPSAVFFRRYDAELNPLGPAVPVSRPEAGFRHQIGDITSVGDTWFLVGRRRPMEGSGLSDSEVRVWTLLGETLLREESLGLGLYGRVTAGQETALVFFSGPMIGTDITGTTGHYQRIGLDGVLLGETTTLPETQSARYGPAATYWNCGYLILSPGWSGASDATDIFHLTEAGDRVTVPLPLELTTTADTGNWFFHEAFSELPRSVGPLLFAGRTMQVSRNTTYTRVMLTCE